MMTYLSFHSRGRFLRQQTRISLNNPATASGETSPRRYRRGAISKSLVTDE
jgi:hypothetical protein